MGLVMNILFAGIVTYNPDIDILNINIKSIRGQLETVIIVDNGSKNFEEIERLAGEHNIQIISNQKNFGIAAALRSEERRVGKECRL